MLNNSDTNYLLYFDPSDVNSQYAINKSKAINNLKRSKFIVFQNITKLKIIPQWLNSVPALLELKHTTPQPKLFLSNDVYSHLVFLYDQYAKGNMQRKPGKRQLIRGFENGGFKKHDRQNMREYNGNQDIIVSQRSSRQHPQQLNQQQLNHRNVQQNNINNDSIKPYFGNNHAGVGCQLSSSLFKPLINDNDLTDNKYGADTKQMFHKYKEQRANQFKSNQVK